MQVVSNPYQSNHLGQYLTSKNSVQKVRINYIYSFQGQEHDDEIKGAGNSLNYEYRMHDPRLGRFFACDPLEEDYPWNSPYAFSENRVIDGVELEGLEWSRINAKGDEVWLISDIITEGLDYLPVVNEIKGLLEAWDGERAFTGDPLSTMERTIGVVPYLSKIPMVKKALKGTSKAVQTEKKVEKGMTSSVKKSVSDSKNKDVATQPVGKKTPTKKPYTPNRKLENDSKTGKPKVDDEAAGKPHTQLGEKKSSNTGAGTYSTRRTVDGNGNVRKQIDYTDHGRPSNHTNPHVHNYKKNNQGQYVRQGAKPLK